MVARMKISEKPMELLFNCTLYKEIETFPKVLNAESLVTMWSQSSFMLVSRGVTQQSTNRLQVFINHCFRRITAVRCPENISTEDLGKITKQQPIVI
jgi:hypothetical protein